MNKIFGTFALNMDPYGALEMPLFSNDTPLTTTFWDLSAEDLSNIMSCFYCMLLI